MMSAHSIPETYHMNALVELCGAQLHHAKSANKNGGIGGQSILDGAQQQWLNGSLSCAE
jgi:hypothetical protein